MRQTSAAAALVGAATSGVFLPPRPASAAFKTNPLTPEAGAAAAAASGERMVWLDEDSGTVSARLSKADDTYGPGFVAYLARFLLNYDEGCREYFKGKLDCALPKRDGSHVWEEFRVRVLVQKRCSVAVVESCVWTSLVFRMSRSRSPPFSLLTCSGHLAVLSLPLSVSLSNLARTQGFVASVGLGLDRFQGADGARELCESLSKKYASGQRDGAPQQIAVLFSLLPPEVQPVPTLKSLLSFPTGSASGFRAVKSAVVGQDLDLESIFGESPSALLPEELRPRYDEGAKAFFVPGVPRLASEREVELAFGARGPFPISKVRVGGRPLLGPSRAKVEKQGCLA